MGQKKKYKAVFVIGIGGKLSNGESHDGRAPDYDDWSTQTPDGNNGLNGDILVWNPILEMAFELSSMGIRVNKESLMNQLEITGETARKDLLFHQRLLNNELPLSIGGGIGQSRLCMFLLKKAHIGEVQSNIWPTEMVDECIKNGMEFIQNITFSKYKAPKDCCFCENYCQNRFLRCFFIEYGLCLIAALPIIF